MTTMTTHLTEIRCQKCSTRFSSAETDLGMPEEPQARVAGWAVWSGKTMGGRDETRVFCPRCYGRTPMPERPGWDAVCDTCDVHASEDWSDDVPLSEEDVEAWRSEHRCESSVRVIDPETVRVAL